MLGKHQIEDLCKICYSFCLVMMSSKDSDLFDLLSIIDFTLISATIPPIKIMLSNTFYLYWKSLVTAYSLRITGSEIWKSVISHHTFFTSRRYTKVGTLSCTYKSITPSKLTLYILLCIYHYLCRAYITDIMICRRQIIIELCSIMTPLKMV